MLLGKKRVIPIIAGVNPLEDATNLDTLLFVDSDKIRFQNGKLRKQHGVQRVFSAEYLQIIGSARNIYSYQDAYGNPISIIGTSYGLYAYLPQNGPIFYNITPLQTTTNAAPNSLSTEYNTGTFTIGTTAGSLYVDVYIDQYLANTETIKISGVTGGPYGGIPAANFNSTFPAVVLSNTHIQIIVATAATETAEFQISMTWATDYLYVKYNSNDQIVGDRIKITGSSDVDGISADTINAEFMISNIVDANTFVIQTGTIATSLVTGGGGSDILIQFQLPTGAKDVTTSAGYGVGTYGSGLYGVGQNTVSANQANIIYPRIWSMQVIGTNLILTPGDPAADTTDNLYLWQNEITIAPVLVSSLDGASSVPLACKWVYSSNNTVVVLGSAGTLNQFYASDVVSRAGNLLPINWTVGAASYAFNTLYAGASPFLSQAKSRDFDLLFTSAEVYVVEFVTKPDIWFSRKLFSTDGIIGPKARGIVQDSVFWMGAGDFYVFDGWTVAVLPNNTIKRYVFDNLNVVQAYKSFVYVNVEYCEVTFFYPSGNQNEPYSNVTYNYKEGHWVISSWQRTASEEFTNVGEKPLLIESDITVSDTIPNGLNTYFVTLDNNPITTTDSSNLVNVAITIDCYLEVGDKIFITGSSAVGGLTADQINGAQTIVATSLGEGGYGSGLYGAGFYGQNGNIISESLYGAGDYGAGFYGGEIEFNSFITFAATSDATSTITGGGSGITVGTQVIGVQYGGNDVYVGETITIQGAQNLDGFIASDLNITTPITYINGTVFQINEGNASSFSTSQISGGGGTSVVLLLDEGAILFKHETGFNDYNVNYNLSTDIWSDQYIPLLSFATTNYAQLDDGDNTMVLHSFYSDINQVGNMTVTLNVKEYAQSVNTISNTYTLSSSMPKIDVQMIGRQRQYTFTSNVLNGDFLMGLIYEEVKPSTPR